MKKLLLVASVIVAALNWSGCDEIEGTPFDDLTNVNTGQKVLVEEFTGHQCGNCPEGSKELQSLLKKYPNQLVVTSIHMGFFAKVKSTGEKFRYDFNTTEGKGFDESQKIDGRAGYPSAFVDRAGYDASNGLIKIYRKSEWITQITSTISKLPTLQIDINNEGDSNEVSSTINLKYLQTSNITNQRLVIYLTEDSVVNWQKDYKTSPEDIQNYVHRHVFRSSPTGMFGISIGSGEVVKGATVSKTFTIPLSRKKINGEVEKLNPKQCHIIAFVVDDITKRVLQVNETSAGGQ